MSNIEKIKEKLARKYIRQHLVNEKLKTEKNIRILKKVISTVLENSQTHSSTGLNALEALLLQLLTKKPSEGGEIGTAYKSLTTHAEQRKSYRRHLMLWIKQLIENHFDEKDMEAKVEASVQNDSKIDIIDEEEDSIYENRWRIVFNDEEELENSDPSEISDYYTFKNLDQEVKDLDSFTRIKGADPTGMNVAERVFGKIRKPIIDALSKLADRDWETKSFTS